jgi:hypothetical protein
MFINKFVLRAAGWSLAVIALLTAQPLCARSHHLTLRESKNSSAL